MRLRRNRVETERRPGRVRRFFRYLDEHSPAEVFGGFFGRMRGGLKATSRHLADPFVASMIIGGVLVVGGLAGIGLAWKGVADQAHVALQSGYLVSGGLGGLAVVLVGLGVLHVQGLRRAAAREHAEMERVREKSSLLLDAIGDLRRSRG